MKTIYTIGYEGTDIDRFVKTLRAVGVDFIADVRALALSRKKGFSKRLLKERLEAEGISYVHFVALGDPKPGREAARAGRFGEFRAIYDDHFATCEAQTSFLGLMEFAQSHNVCMLCFERDPLHCHRSIVAEKMKAYDICVENLYGDSPRRYEHYAAKSSCRDLGQGASAAEQNLW